jgi:GT2 family glycosyltransferase
MSEPLMFSIIVPTYQRHAQLAACLASLSVLDFPRELFEVVVVDDGSTPRVDEVCEPFRSSLDLKLVAQENAGPAAARNRGASVARGARLVFIDDDCYPAPDYLRALAARFRESPNALVGGRTINALAENPYSATSQLIIETVYDLYNASASGATFFASNNFAVPADAFRDAGGFDERFRCSEDRDFCERWRARDGAMIYAHEAVVYHAHGLTPVALWRQHFGYGRGAFMFHEQRAARTGAQFKPDPAFYAKLLRAAIAQPTVPRAVLMTTLLAWAQLANAAGYARERLALSRARVKARKFEAAEN